jgi:hypothetical protein
MPATRVSAGPFSPSLPEVPLHPARLRADDEGADDPGCPPEPRAFAR